MFTNTHQYYSENSLSENFCFTTDAFKTKHSFKKYQFQHIMMMSQLKDITSV